VAENTFDPIKGLAGLEEAQMQIRAVLDDMAVVPNLYRTRLLVALRLLEELRAQIKDIADRA
jgi:hypothetical protein